VTPVPGSGPTVDRLIGSTVDGKYRIESLLGRGGMGAVFRAVHLGTDRTVALKVIVPDYAGRADFLARFEREARACGRLRHPNIVDVTDFGYDDSNGPRIAYLVMEYLDGCSLADVLRDEGALPIAWAVDVLQQTGSAVEEAHRAGILHRDLKPDNIWLEPNRRGGYTVKVLDFGLAKLGMGDTDHAGPPAGPHCEAGTADPTGESTREFGDAPASAPATDAEEPTRIRPSVAPTRAVDDDSATALGSIMGTPAYMSPEQCQGLPLTARTDVYSLAVIAYRLLGGALPFAGRSDALLAAHISQTPRPLGELRRDLPRQATALVMRALAKSPDERPASAGAFTEMLAAQAQTVGSFLEDALLMFLQHARAFVSVSVVGLAPVLLLGLFAALNALAFVYGTILVPRAQGGAFVLAAILMALGPGILLVQGAVVPAVMQAVVAPLQPIDVKTLQLRFRPRMRAYVRAVSPVIGFFVFAGLWQFAVRPLMLTLMRDPEIGIGEALFVALLPSVPTLGLIFLMVRGGSAQAYQFLGAVAVVEGLSGRKAVQRCAALAKSGIDSRPMRALLVGLGASLGFFGSVGVLTLSRRLPVEVAIGVLGIFFALAFVLFGPFVAVIGALNYLRARRALGEPLDRALADFERAVLPESHWKLGERERVATLIASRR
jgi:serine/threonine protein kinase